MVVSFLEQHAVIFFVVRLLGVADHVLELSYIEIAETFIQVTRSINAQNNFKTFLETSSAFLDKQLQKEIFGSQFDFSSIL